MTELPCSYKNEVYSVRNTGEVYRHARPGKSIRIYDNKWTFGKPNASTGYMELASIRVHRIVAVAFHGEPPTHEHVVDHRDTNKQNNRPENLRWVTRLENILLNPITIKRIELSCGCSVEEFLNDPSKFRDKFQEPNYSWMCTVSREEAQSSLDRMLTWARDDKSPTGGSLGRWIFSRTNFQKPVLESVPDEPELILALTPNAAQRDWETPTEFPCCPLGLSDQSLPAYSHNLSTGSIFCRNKYTSTFVFKHEFSTDQQSLYIISESAESIKPFTLARVTFENGLFIHTGMGTFFTQNGVEKELCLAQGNEWTGEDSIDDYC